VKSSSVSSTFASRDPGNGAIDVFFPYRRGNKRSYLYLRRDRDGEVRFTSIDKVRVDSLLYRMFLVFNTDALKTHRIFKELCRHINVRAGKYNVHHVLAAFERLGRDDLLLLGIYAPALDRLRARDVDVDGPVPADTVFRRALDGTSREKGAPSRHPTKEVP